MQAGGPGMMGNRAKLGRLDWLCLIESQGVKGSTEAGNIHSAPGDVYGRAQGPQRGGQESLLEWASGRAPDVRQGVPQ